MATFLVKPKGIFLTYGGVNYILHSDYYVKQQTFNFCPFMNRLFSCLKHHMCVERKQSRYSLLSSATSDGRVSRLAALWSNHPLHCPALTTHLQLIMSSIIHYINPRLSLSPASHPPPVYLGSRFPSYLVSLVHLVFLSPETRRTSTPISKSAYYHLKTRRHVPTRCRKTCMCL